MAATIPAMVTPTVLAWARKESGFDPEPVAKKLQVTLEKLLAWEHGELKPTMRQAQNLAKIYHRPLGVFFLPQPPAIPPLAAEYRRLPGVSPGTESPELRLAIRVMSQRRELTLDLSKELGQAIQEFSASVHLNETPGDVGARLRSLLGISAQEQLGWRDEWQAWRRWREATELIGVLVFQFPKVPLNQVRGVSLLLFPFPAIGINSKESSAAARSFTLMHELAHITLAIGKEEQVALKEKRDDSKWAIVERFAEEVASAVLIPDDMLSGFLSRMSLQKDSWDVPLVRQLASKFRVTPLAMATRLRSVGALSWNGYQHWKDDWEAYLATLKPRGGGFASPVDKTLGRGGRPFVQLVVEAMDANRITAVEACRYLDLRFDHFEKLRGELRKGPGSAPDGGDDGD
jgi:Zn-dependent peptidase ImmA (M78 family)/transcriptional regulator with XRE-family HTH domain